MPRHDRAYGQWRQRGRKAGNQRRVPSRMKTRKKVYVKAR